MSASVTMHVAVTCDGCGDILSNSRYFGGVGSAPSAEYLEEEAVDDDAVHMTEDGDFCSECVHRDDDDDDDNEDESVDTYQVNMNF